MACHVKTFAMSVVVYISGCASVDLPPSHWPAPILAESNRCPDLSGSYKNYGVNVEGGKSSPLVLRVFPDTNKNWTNSDVENRNKFFAATHLSFFGPNRDGLRIEAWKDNELIGKIKLKRELGDGFRCKAGALYVSLPVTAQAGGGVFFDTLQEAILMHANEGSLIVKYNNTGVGLGFYVIPVAMKFEVWSLYRAAKPLP